MLVILCLAAHAQRDSSRLGRLEAQVRRLTDRVVEDSTRLAENERNTFYLYKYIQPQDSAAPNLSFTGYVDAYVAGYTDSVEGDFHRFPTSAPRSGQLGLNMLYFAANYSSSVLKANVGLHFGDIPASAWSERYNLIQEANAGIRLVRRVWLEAGFFRTHIGMESIQPRENIAHSLAVTTYFEPYFLSGAKLSYQPGERWTLQVNAFNGFNGFVETNRNKAVGASIVHVFDTHSAITFNTIYSDESPTGQARRQPRWYNDLYFVHHGEKLDLGAEANLGFQQNTGLVDSTQTAMIYSFILAAKYKVGRMGFYGRGEMFEDSDEILTGPVQNENHQLVGINLLGGTAGVEYRPLPNAYLRAEGRYLHTTEREDIFYYAGEYYHYRVEGIAAMGLWF